MPNVFDNSIQVLINGKVVDSIVTSTGGVLYERLPSSFLSIDVPLNLVYSDAFLINGNLTDKNDNGIVGETVKLKVGSTVVDSTTTTTNGAYSFTQTPVSTGNHTFQVVYEGSERYDGSVSSVVERVVNKETTVLSLTNPVNNSSVYSDGSVSVNGVLVTDDNEKLSNKSIVVKEGNTTITTFTTNSNGVFTGSITGLNVGTHSLTFQFVSDTNYTGSYVDRTVIVNSPTLSLTGDKTLIMGGETITLTATYIGGVKEGRTVTFKVGSTTLGTATTNSNGVATYTYTGGYVGTTTVTAVCNSVQSTYTFTDADYVDNGSNYLNRLTASTNSKGNVLSSPSDNFGMMYFSENSYANSTFYLEPNSVFEFDIVEYTGNFTIRCDSIFENQNLFNQSNVTAPSHIKIINYGTTIEYYIDNVKSTINNVLSDNRRLTIRVNANSTFTYKNLHHYSLPCEPKITISADKSIIQTSETSNMVIKLHNYGGVADKILTYEIKHGSTIIDSGTDTTDSNGQISISYVGTGVGDIEVIVSYGSLLQETYGIQDCHLYDTASSSSGLSNYGTPIPLQSNNTNCQIEYDSTMNAYKVTDQSNSIKGIPFNLNNLPSEIKIECDLYVRTGTANSVIGIFGGSASNGFDYLSTNFENWLFAKNIFTGSTQSILLSSTNKTGQWVHLTVENNNGSVTATFSQNDTTIVTDTISTSSISQYGIATGWGNGYYAWIKNIKVKAL